MASETGPKVAGFAHQPLGEWTKEIAAGEATQPEGALLIVVLATPTKFVEGADTASSIFGGVALEQAEAGQKCRALHPNCGLEVGPYVYNAGSASDAVVGKQVCVKDNQTVELVSASSNKNVCGRITRVLAGSTTKVWFKCQTELNETSALLDT